MKVYYRKTNSGEIYCCSLKSAKKMFEETPIKLNFGEFKRNYAPYQNEMGYSFFKKYIRGKVICSLNIESGIEDPFLSFFVIKNIEFPTTLQKRIENEILYQIYDFYIKMVFCKYKYASLLVELLDGELILHEDIIR